MSTAISGTCAPAFEAVADAFNDNFEQHGEIGARVAVTLNGETVVDLWGGHTGVERETPWQEDTLVCCHSVTKGVVALAAHRLATLGLLDYDAPVARYWPEFAAAGKDAITVRQALAHQASLAIIDSAVPGDALDWSGFTAKIAAQAPNWPVATNEAYHSVTFGYLVGEIVRRIDGRPIERFIADELCTPCEADFVLGCSDAEVSRVVSHIPNPDNQLMNGGLFNERTLPLFASMPNVAIAVASPSMKKKPKDGIEACCMSASTSASGSGSST